MKEHNYYIYIMTNSHNTVLYTGVTNDLQKRIYEHKTKQMKSSFTSKYNINKLVYYEHCEEIESAIAREKQIKNGSRDKKMKLVESVNPEWSELLIDG